MAKLSHEPNTGPLKLTHERAGGWGLTDWALVLLAIGSAGMLGLSFAYLSEESGPLANLKIILLTLSAALAAYCVNRFAIERGAPLAAIGFRAAGVLSVAAILITGFGLYVGSLSGMTLREADARQLERHGIALGAYVATRHAAALSAQEAGAAIGTIAGDLERLATCERLNSCLSGDGYGGRGPVSRLLEDRAGRAQGVARAFVDGVDDRRDLLDDLNDLGARYREALADTSRSLNARRIALQGLHGEIEQASAALDEALPAGLLASFADDLEKGAALPDNPAVARKVEAVLRAHAAALNAALPAGATEEVSPPAFPPRPGMIDALRFIGDFAALAAVIFVAELCLPITLWALTFLRLTWEIERRAANDGPRREVSAARRRADPGFGDLLDPPVASAVAGAVDHVRPAATGGEEVGQDGPAPASAPAKRRPRRTRRST